MAGSNQNEYSELCKQLVSIKKTAKVTFKEDQKWTKVGNIGSRRRSELDYLEEKYNEYVQSLEDLKDRLDKAAEKVPENESIPDWINNLRILASKLMAEVNKHLKSVERQQAKLDTDGIADSLYRTKITTSTSTNSRGKSWSPSAIRS